MAFTFRIGSVRSMRPEVFTVATLPAASSTDTFTSSKPSEIAIGTLADQVPSPRTVALKLCVSPLPSVMSMVTSAPISSDVPLISGVSLARSVIGLMFRIGNVRSIRPEVFTVARLPAASSTDTLTSSKPSEIAMGTLADQVPSPRTVALKLWVSPLPSVMSMVTSAPISSEVPEINGVSLARSVIGLIFSTGSVRSINPEVLTVATLPASSMTDASIVSNPSLRSDGTLTDQVPSG